jgi:hypothetical protein
MSAEKPRIQISSLSQLKPVPEVSDNNFFRYVFKFIASKLLSLNNNPEYFIVKP